MRADDASETGTRQERGSARKKPPSEMNSNSTYNALPQDTSLAGIRRWERNPPQLVAEATADDSLTFGKDWMRTTATRSSSFQ